MSYALAGASAASQTAGTIADLLKQADAENARAQAVDVLRRNPDLVLPDADYSYLNYVGDYSPYSLGTPQAAQYQTISEDPATRAIQMDALKQLVAQANGAADAQGAADRFHALDDANQLAKGREGAIRQQMERRGQGGTGLNALMQAQASQMAANRAQGGTLDAVSKAALQKLAAMQGAVGAAGQVRGQDFNTQRYNADTINDFNRLNTGLTNQWHAQDVANQNAAQLRNIGTKQDIAGRNTGIANSNIDRKTANAQAQYNARANKATGISNALGGQANQFANTGNVANTLGQQGSQLFTNIGAGAAAYNAANQPQGGFTPTPSRQPDYESLDGSYRSWWE